MDNMKYPKLGEIIKEIRGDMSQKAFAKIINAQQGSISKYENSDEMPGADILIRIAKFKGITVEQLMQRASGEEYFENDVPQISVDPFISNINDNYVKLTGYEITGAGNEMLNSSYEPVGTVIVPKSIYKPHYIPFYVEGDSMEKMIMNHSYILVDRSPQKRLRDKNVYCFGIPYSGFIIRLIHTEPDALFLEPVNKQYKIRRINWSAFEPDWVIGRVVCSIVNIYPS